MKTVPATALATAPAKGGTPAELCGRANFLAISDVNPTHTAMLGWQTILDQLIPFIVL